MFVQKPLMGWNSWNTFGQNINEELILETADAIVEKGLDKVGYEYVVIDDCWALKQRDPVTGRLVPNPDKFPHGMKYVSDYIHSKGLKFGLYTCVGVTTCGGYPGSFGHEFLDAETFADFGVDFLKVDYCAKPSAADGAKLYLKLAMALRATGRDIVLSICNWGRHDVHQWARSVGGHMYRSTVDICDCYSSFVGIALSQENNLCYSAPGCFNDLDMLTVGMAGHGHVSTSQYSFKEYRTQFSLWCLFGSPLMLGCDIRTVDEETLALIKNETLIRINQDPDYRAPIKQAAIRMYLEGQPVYFRMLSHNEYAIGMFNVKDGEGDVAIYFAELGITPDTGYAFELTDAYTGEYVGVYDEYFNQLVAPHSSRMYTAKLVKK